VIDIPKQARTDAVASIRRYFDENINEPIGDLAAGLLLNYFLEEIGPVIYNQAIADVQRRLEQRVSELGSELFAEEFQYWPNVERKKKARR
jgi:uncharacterized protein (DUF2164 family)